MYLIYLLIAEERSNLPHEQEASFAIDDQTELVLDDNLTEVSLRPTSLCLNNGVNIF